MARGIGPNSREGQLTEALSNLPQEMVKFTPIAGKRGPVDAALLVNADQKYYTLEMGIQEGYDYIICWKYMEKILPYTVLTTFGSYDNFLTM